MRRRISASGLILVAAALLAAGTGSGAAAPAKVVTPVVRSVTLTVSSGGSSLLATRGELIVVELTGGHLRWSTVRAVQATPVLRRVPGGATTATASRTEFRVVGYGTAGLVATGTPVCRSTSACPQDVVLWHVGVVVPVVDPPGPTAASLAVPGPARSPDRGSDPHRQVR